uniref:Methyltransferase domain-containing protein n=1 Tax=Moniliophthora roreri TaxID=221103 RepID=A0A0W0FRX8_MONRR
MATKQKILKHNASQPGIILQPVAKTVWPSPRTTGDSRVGPAGPTSYVYMIKPNLAFYRLDEQFWYYKAHHRRNLDQVSLELTHHVAHHPSTSLQRIIASSGAWILNFSKEAPSSMELHAIDLSPTHFRFDAAPSNVHFTQSSVTSMPRNWTRKFDFIQQSFLISSLSTRDWPIAIAELYRVLKPGGHLQIQELTSFLGVEQLNGARPGSAAMIVRNIMAKIREKYDYLVHPPSQIVRMLEECGFKGITCDIKEAPRLGSRFGGESGAAGLDLHVRALKTMKEVVETNEGFGIVHDGNVFDSVMDRYATQCEEEGLPAYECCLICAQK